MLRGRSHLLSFSVLLAFLVGDLEASRSSKEDDLEISIEESRPVSVRLLLQNETAATGETEETQEIEESRTSSFDTLGYPSMEAEVIQQDTARWKNYLRYGGGLLLGAGVANGMIPVYLEDLEEYGFRSQSLLKLGMVYAGVTFGIESFAFALQRSHSSLKWYWDAVASFCALVPPLLLFNVEQQHHLSSGHQGWDEYYTFFAILAPFLYVNEYFVVSDYILSFLKTERQKQIDYAVEQLSPDEVQYLSHAIITEKRKHVELPMLELPANSMLPWQKKMYLAGAGAVALTSFPFFQELWGGYDVIFNHHPLLFAMSCASIIAEGVMIHSFLYEVSRRDLWTFFPQGAFKSIPVFATTLYATRDSGWYIRYPSLLVFPVYSGLKMGRITRNAIEILLQQLPCRKSRPFLQKRQLKELLR